MLNMLNIFYGSFENQVGEIMGVNGTKVRLVFGYEKKETSTITTKLKTSQQTVQTISNK